MVHIATLTDASDQWRLARLFRSDVIGGEETLVRLLRKIERPDFECKNWRTL